VLHYRTAEATVPRVQQKAKALAAGPALAVKFTLQFKDTQQPANGVRLIAFTDYENRAGEEAVTNAKGEARFTSLRAGDKVERLYVLPPPSGYWGFFKKGLKLKADNRIVLRPIEPGLADGVRHFYAATAQARDGEGVRVAVADTGVDGTHPDVRVSGGSCTVTGEDPADWGPKAGPHGTHVAGIVAARGKWAGVAPEAELMSYRVFGADDLAANFAIAKAIDQAVESGCDLVNLSLKYDVGPDKPPQVDDVIREAIAEARERGVVVLAATGNDGRQRVAFPALDAAALAVSALGRKGTYPSDSLGRADEQAPYGTDKKNFAAAFTNIGGEVDVIGPGVDIISTVPGGGYAPMSGTSMATPAITGLVARLLSRNPAVRDLPRDATRADAIMRLILASCKDLGFKPHFQGDGIPL
jgi:subtilisin